MSAQTISSYNYLKAVLPIYLPGYSIISDDVLLSKNPLESVLQKQFEVYVCGLLLSGKLHYTLLLRAPQVRTTQPFC